MVMIIDCMEAYIEVALSAYDEGFYRHPTP